MLSNAFMDFVASIIIIFPAFLIGLSFHEFSHALVAYLLGDDTAKKEGRLTLNPLAHMDLIGTLFLIFLRVGWAKPVPFDTRNFKYPRIYAILTAMAGPLANFIIAYISFWCLKFFTVSSLITPVKQSFLQIFEAISYINVMLGVFNLLPLPPLDGSHFIFALLLKKFPGAVVWLYKYSMFILLGLFLLPETRNALLVAIIFVYNFIKSLVF